ncbi:hypothetical protein DVS77_10860 [Mycolicibacterium moriokaense]|nr:hypothetical protein DVS77_10860 [Mycolicibacterium moriokaense]
MASTTAAPAALADDSGVALNGTFRVSSNGEWAKSNDVFIDQKTKVQTWTISSQCTTPIDCYGQVTSDLGWTVPIRYDTGFWYVDVDIPHWSPCPDGTVAPGHETFRLWGVDPFTTERITTNVQQLAGRDITKTPSGACGKNNPLVIELPVFMERI